MKWGELIKMAKEKDNGSFKVGINKLQGTKEQKVKANIGDMLQVRLLSCVHLFLYIKYLVFINKICLLTFYTGLK